MKRHRRSCPNPKRRLRRLVLLATLLLGCAAPDPSPSSRFAEGLLDGPVYYWQSVIGHLDLMWRARPIDQWLAQPNLDRDLQQRLHRVAAIRDFASSELGLPANGSYAKYAEIDRPFVVWNVVATPELALEPLRWCFPVAGCVSYRGYYALAGAEEFARRLRMRGLDVAVSGVPAYSTLGWLNDPVLSSFIRYPEAELARLVFHELAHQLVYVPGDTAFNEAFATAVEEAGVERWLAFRNDPRLQQGYAEQQARRQAFYELLRQTRERLVALCRSAASAAEQRQAKQHVLDGLHLEYQALRSTWGGFGGYDRWFEQPVNNARLAAVGSYTDLLPAFRTMLAESGGDLRLFYAAVRELASMPPREREARLGKAPH